MNAIAEAPAIDQKAVGIYHKFNVERTDGSSAPGGKHEGDEYFVLNLTTDKHALPALAAYAKSCANDYPVLAADLRTKCQSLQKDEFAQVPETTLPNGHVEPAFLVGKYLSGRGDAGQLVVNAEAAPWVEIDYHAARAAAEAAGYKLITETQYLALAYNIANVAANWSSGIVGEGSLQQGLRNDSVDEAQPGTFISNDEDETRVFTLSNGETVYDVAGNAYSWVFDNVQGDENGLIAKSFAADSPSITTAPAPSMQKGVGWYPSAGSDWSGHALVRGGYWDSGDYAGVFRLGGGHPGCVNDGVGFRCTK